MEKEYLNYISANYSIEESMTVKDVLRKVHCFEKCTPILIYSNAGKVHVAFDYGDFLDGIVHPNYLNESVESWKQFENHGVVQIVLK